MVRSYHQTQAGSDRERAQTTRKEKTRVLIDQINRQSGKAVEDLPQIEQKAEQSRQKQDVDSGSEEAAGMPNKDSRRNMTETKYSSEVRVDDNASAEEINRAIAGKNETSNKVEGTFKEQTTDKTRDSKLSAARPQATNKEETRKRPLSVPTVQKGGA